MLINSKTLLLVGSRFHAFRSTKTPLYTDGVVWHVVVVIVIGDHGIDGNGKLLEYVHYLLIGLLYIIVFIKYPMDQLILLLLLYYLYYS